MPISLAILVIGALLLFWGIREYISLSKEPWDELDEISRKEDEDPKA